MIAESYERIHRSNLVGMGIIPLQYQPGNTADSLGLTGQETYTIELSEKPKMGELVTVKVHHIISFFRQHRLILYMKTSARNTWLFLVINNQKYMWNGSILNVSYKDYDNATI